MSSPGSNDTAPAAGASLSDPPKPTDHVPDAPVAVADTSAALPAPGLGAPQAGQAADAGVEQLPTPMDFAAEIAADAASSSALPTPMDVEFAIAAETERSAEPSPLATEAATESSTADDGLPTPMDGTA